MNGYLRRIACSALALAGIGLAGCSGAVDTTNNPPVSPGPPAIIVPAVGTRPVFDPAAGAAGIPLPNDLLRNPQTGFVDQIPNTPPFNAEPFTSLRTLRGFSTSANIVIPFDGPVNGTSVSPSSVIIANLNSTIQPQYETFVGNPLVTNTTVNSTIVARPLRPLQPLTTYLVVVTPQVTGVNGSVTPNPTIQFTKVTTPLVQNGVSAVNGLSDAQATALEPLRVAYQPIWAAAERVTGIPRAEIPLAFTFGTQPEFFTLQSLRATAVAQNRGINNGTIPIATNATVVQGFYNTTLRLPAVAAANISRIFTGNFTMPDYIGTPTNSSFFQGTGAPGDPVVVKAERPVPFVALFPDATAFPGPRPCIIFQHGITRTKNDVFAIASTACSAGFGIIAIDLPLHGSLDPTGPGVNPANVTQNFVAPSPGGGSSFINLSSPRTSRDNGRQSAVDLYYVAQAVVSGQTNMDGQPGPEFAPLPPAFIGTSLGGMVGTVWSATDASSRIGVYNVPGGRISSLLINSQTFGPSIQAGLAQQGVVNGTAAWQQFWLLFQTVVDDGDPFNYGQHLTSGALKGNSPTASLMQYYIGDQVVPNVASEDLARSILAPQVQPVQQAVSLLEQVTAPFRGSGVFQFPQGNNHGAILDPSQGNIVAIRTQAFTFIGSGFQTQANATIIAPANTSANDTSAKADTGGWPAIGAPDTSGIVFP